MISTKFIKAQKLFKVLFLFGIVGFFAYCTSSTNKLASSFSKRKYTKGHFSDPVAKTNLDYSPYGANITLAPKNQLQAPPVENTPAAVNEKAGIKGTAKSISSKGNEITKSPVISYKNNVSLKENMPYNPYHHYGDDNGHDQHSSSGSSFLLAWILCLIASVICFLLLVADAASFGAGIGGGLGAGCVLYVLGGFLFIAAVVLFILWIVTIVKG